MRFQEARRYVRRRVELSARLACLDADRDPRTGALSYRMFSARTVDISDGGLAVRADEAVNTGRRVVIELELPDGRVVELAGRVVWLEPSALDDRPARMGIELASLSAGLVQIATRSTARS